MEDLQAGQVTRPQRAFDVATNNVVECRRLNEKRAAFLSLETQG
jgi:hypothetical protein